ncbi:MAG: class I SAM-dependent methyltransferase [Candidatus Peribacteraceae bacterium]
MKNPFTSLVSIPRLWNGVQVVLGAPTFKRELYRSKLHPGSRLLDFGCASGHLADAFLDFDYYGVDLDPHAIASARERFKGRQNMHFIAADLRTRPFATDFFDEILFAATVHHLTDSLMRELLTELHHCLKPGGVVHLFDPVYKPTDRWWQRFFRAIDHGKYTRSTEEIIAIIEPLKLFRIGIPSYHPPYGALLQDCDFLYLPLKKA